MLNRQEKQRKDLLIAAVACAICATFLALMLIAAYADLIVVSASDYQKQGSELASCREVYEQWDDDVAGPYRGSWDDVPIEGNVGD